GHRRPGRARGARARGRDITTAMKALQLVGTRRLEVADVPAPAAPGADDVLIRVAAVGICGTDLHYYRGEPAGYESLELPFIMGHEFAGVVEATGRNVIGLRA